MNSRYNFIAPSLQRDIDNETYPDPLTLQYTSFEVTEPMTPVELTQRDILYFWLKTAEIYGTAEYDDIVLTLNGVSHKNELYEGQVLLFPSRNDIESSYGT
jgi:hypothetical protein